MSPHNHSGRTIRSGRGRPCPIDDCRREKDGDCSWTADGEQVFCHHARHDIKPGHVIGDWAFTGNTEDGRCAHFVPHREQQRPHRRTIVTPSSKGFSDPKQDQKQATPARPSITQLELARCTPIPPTELKADTTALDSRAPKGQLVCTWQHSPTQYVERWDRPETGNAGATFHNPA